MPCTASRYTAWGSGRCGSQAGRRPALAVRGPVLRGTGVVLLAAQTSVAADPRTQFQLLSSPLYMVGQTSRLCETVLRNKADWSQWRSPTNDP